MLKNKVVSCNSSNYVDHHACPVHRYRTRSGRPAILGLGLKQVQSQTQSHTMLMSELTVYPDCFKAFVHILQANIYKHYNLLIYSKQSQLLKKLT